MKPIPLLSTLLLAVLLIPACTARPPEELSTEDAALIILEDDFSRTDTGWSVFGDSETAQVGYGKDNFQIIFYKQGGFQASWSVDEFDDCIVETEFSIPRGSGAGAGLTLQATDQNWYLVLIYPETKEYSFFKTLSGEGSWVKERQPSSVIQPTEEGERLYMRLKIFMHGDAIEIHAAGSSGDYASVATVHDSALSRGHLGPAAEPPKIPFDSPVVVLFDWIRVSQYIPATATQQASVTATPSLLKITNTPMPRSGWFQSNLDGFGNLDNIGIFSLGEYKGSLFAGTRNIVTGAEIWKLVDGDWLKVMEGGFGSAANQAIDHLIEFKGQLYASTWNVASDTASYGTEIWRFDGDGEWEKVVSAGFGEVNNGESTLVVYKDRLYAGTWALDPNLRPPEIWASKTGDADDWVLVLQGGITEGNYGVVCFSEYDGYLYAGTANFSGAQVWRTKDGSTWEQVAVNGIDDPANMSVTAVEEYQEYLYASVGTSWDAPRAQVWRCKECDGNDWALVKSGGYHYPDTWRKGALEVYHGDLYQVIGNQEYGLEVWCTTDGMNWEEVIFEGFGDKKNIYTYFDNAILVFDDRLYLGVDKLAGEGGGEIWSGFLP